MELTSPITLQNLIKLGVGYETVFSKGIVKDYPLTILHTSGRRIEVLYNATLFKNENGEVQVFLAQPVISLTGKIAEEELRKSKKCIGKAESAPYGCP